MIEEAVSNLVDTGEGSVPMRYEGSRGMGAEQFGLELKKTNSGIPTAVPRLRKQHQEHMNPACRHRCGPFKNGPIYCSQI